MIYKVILLGICVSVLNIFLRNTQKIFIIPINISYIIIVAFLVFDSAIETVNEITDLIRVSTSASKMLSCLYKGAIICVLTKISFGQSDAVDLSFSFCGKYY